jgi:hypothetical protein
LPPRALITCAVVRRLLMPPLYLTFREVSTHIVRYVSSQLETGWFPNCV